MKLRPFCVSGLLVLAGCQPGAEDPEEPAKAAAAAGSEDNEKGNGAPANTAEGDAVDETIAAEPAKTPEPKPKVLPKPTFADEVVPLTGGDEPSADSGKTAWKHLKAKEYGLAQKHFALAALHDRESYKPAFNLACAAALAGDEPMARIALTEAIKRDKDTVAPKARKDGDLASMRDKEWFDTVLAGESEDDGSGERVDDLPDEALEQEASMYFVLAWGPKGPGGVALLYEEGFMGWLDEGRRLDVSRDGADYVLRINGTPYIAANLEDADRVDVEPKVGSPWAFDAITDGEFWVAGSKGLAHYEGGKWTVLDTASTVHADSNARPIAIEHDAGGTEWVATTAAVYRVDADAVEAATVPGAGKPLNLILQGTSLYLGRDSDVLTLESGAWKTVAGTASGETVSAVTVHGDGSVVQGLANGGLRRVQGGSAQSLSLPGVDSIDSLGTDAANRTWVGTPSGIFVVKADFSGVLRHYATGSIEELRASEAGEEVLQFLALGGPVKLPPSTKERGVVIGRLMYKGKPLANRAFEMCDDPARKSSEMGSMGTPCEMSEPSWYAKTDADGKFRLTGVEPKGFDFAAFVPGHKVGATHDSPCCFDLPDEGTLDLGDVKLK